MSRFRPARALGIAAGALGILALGVYGPATLLGPLPALEQAVATRESPVAPAPPALPAAGASAIIVTGATEPLAAAGVAEPLPMASAAKIVTALVVLDAKPLGVGAPGDAVPITAAEYRDYIDYGRTGNRAVAVFPGETWTQRDLLQAMILGSSNNHADSLARWAFGSLDDYVSAAADWLQRQGLEGTRVVDATGLDDASRTTATDAARLAGMAAADPVIADILANPATALAGQRGVTNTTSYLPEEGITGISRSYTDAAGICFLFTASVAAGEETFTFSGAFLGQPDYDSLAADLAALMAGARSGVTAHPVLAEGEPYVVLHAPWGDQAAAVVGVTKERVGWPPMTPPPAHVTLEAITTGRAGTPVGRVSVTLDGEEVSAPLVLDSAITDPGPGWRLLNPVPVISALVSASR